ncbi:MAG: hypothetical protein ABSF26_05860 [Thermoguttaceae bacterium]|jgi:hypothetical protein
MPKQKEKSKVKPVHEIRLGRLVAAIWENHLDDDSIRHNVTFSRLYKPEGEQWRNSSSFGRDDLLLLGKLADRAHSWIYDHSQEQNGSSNEHNGDASNEDVRF